MDALPHHLGLFAHIRTLTGQKCLFTSFFDVKIQVDRDNWELLKVLRCLKVLVRSDLTGL